MKPNISVIIPTYNRRYCLGRALDSVLAQTLLPNEVIVIDDGSTDGTTAWLRMTYPQIKLIQQANHGVSHARNVGIKAAKGAWIVLLDSDDAWVPGKLEQQMLTLQQSPQYRFCHTNEIWYRNGVRVNAMNKHQKSGGWIFARCLKLCLISPSSAMIHRSVFEEIGLFNETLPACEDYDLWLRITAKMPVLYLATPLTVKYGGHKDQLSRQFWGMDRFRIASINKLLAQGSLSEENSNAANAMLIHKIQIYLKGAYKRAKQQDIQIYENLLKQYQSAVKT